MRRWSPPPGATRAEVRRYGLGVAILGVLSGLFGAALVFALDRLTSGALLRTSGGPHPSRLRFVAGLPLLFGFVLSIAGAYRAVTGIAPADDGRTWLARVGRLAFATLTAALVLAAIAAIAVSRGR